jgi:hypothetical protein
MIRFLGKSKIFIVFPQLIDRLWRLGWPSYAVATWSRGNEAATLSLYPVKIVKLRLPLP